MSRPPSRAEATIMRPAIAAALLVALGNVGALAASPASGPASALHRATFCPTPPPQSATPAPVNTLTRVTPLHRALVRMACCAQRGEVHHIIHQVRPLPHPYAVIDLCGRGEMVGVQAVRVIAQRLPGQHQRTHPAPARGTAGVRAVARTPLGVVALIARGGCVPHGLVGWWPPGHTKSLS